MMTERFARKRMNVVEFTTDHSFTDFLPVPACCTRYDPDSAVNPSHRPVARDTVGTTNQEDACFPH